MRKIILSTIVSLIAYTGSSYAVVIPFSNNPSWCTELAQTDASFPQGCNTLSFSAANSYDQMVNPGDNFSITCTFSAGLNNPNNEMPLNISALVNPSINITYSSYPVDTVGQWYDLPTKNLTKATFSWQGKANTTVVPTFFGISFMTNGLHANQTINVACSNS